MNFSKSIEIIFEAWIERLGRSNVLNADFGRRAIIAYSGGKDSSILLLFYEFLHSKYLIPRPAVFHLNHQIRNNAEQENAIASFISSRYPHHYLKKKIFLLSLNV